MACSTLSRDMTVEDFGIWLREKGFSDEVQQHFKDEEMDGEAIFDAFGFEVGPDCLKDVLPKYGLRIKVYRAIKSAMGTILQQEQRQEPSVVSDSSSSKESTSTVIPVSSFESTSYKSSPSSSSSLRSPLGHFTTAKVTKGNKLPDPFPVPLFRQATEEHLNNNIFYPDDRHYMVRVLATMILSHVSKATVSDCEHVAKALVQKFPFLKEYHSWAQFIYVRCQNCNRKPSSDAPRAKRPKLKPVGNHMYPALDGEPEDEASHKRNMKLLDEECGKCKPSSTNIKDLMSRTFLNRREWILNSELPVSEIIENYPSMTKISYIAHEMDMICHVERTASIFKEKWKFYVQIILAYSKSIPFQSKQLKEILKSLDDDDDSDGSEF